MAFAAFFFSASAQLQLGGGLSYGTEAEEIGLNLRGLYGITENIAAGADFVYYFAGENFNYTEFNINANYFFLTDELRPYALLGINRSTVSFSSPFFGTVSNGEWGLNVGAGTQYTLSDNLSLFGEARYIIGDFDQLVISAGVFYTLNF